MGRWIRAISKWSVSAAAALCVGFLSGCSPPAGGGGGGGGNPSTTCNTLAMEAGELAQEISASGGAISNEQQCRLLANQIATIDAGCFDQVDLPPGIDLDSQRAAYEQQQEDLGCVTADLDGNDGSVNVSGEAGNTPNDDATAAFRVRVTDTNGNPLPSALVSFENGIVASDANGNAVSAPAPAGAVAIVKVQLDGYANSIVEVTSGTAGSGAKHLATMIAAETVVQFVAEDGASIQSDGLNIDIPPNAIVDSRGNPVNGEVTLTVALLGLNRAEEWINVPFVQNLSISEDGQDIVANLAIAAHTLTRNGDELQIADDALTRFEWIIDDHPILDDLGGLTVGQQLTIRTLDEATGRWNASGTGEVRMASDGSSRFAVIAEIGHFSYSGVEFGRFPESLVKCHHRRLILECPNGREVPAAGARIEYQGVDFLPVAPNGIVNISVQLDEDGVGCFNYVTFPAGTEIGNFNGERVPLGLKTTVEGGALILGAGCGFNTCSTTVTHYIDADKFFDEPPDSCECPAGQFFVDGECLGMQEGIWAGGGVANILDCAALGITGYRLKIKRVDGELLVTEAVDLPTTSAGCMGIFHTPGCTETLSAEPIRIDPSTNEVQINYAIKVECCIMGECVVIHHERSIVGTLAGESQIVDSQLSGRDFGSVGGFGGDHSFGPVAGGDLTRIGDVDESVDEGGGSGGGQFGDSCDEASPCEPGLICVEAGVCIPDAG